MANLFGSGGGPRLNDLFFLNPSAVFDEGLRDVLTGGDNLDWFLLNADGDGGASDQATDGRKGEVATDVNYRP